MLNGKIALVTGAAKGIGRAIALALAAEGAVVVVNYNGSRERAEQTLEEIRALGADGCVYQCNVADTEAALAMVKEVTARYGRLDILVNNAGITRDNLIMKMSEEDFDAVICIRYSWQCRTGELCVVQGGRHRPDKDHGAGAGKPRHHSERGGAGLCGYGHDSGAF